MHLCTCCGGARVVGSGALHSLCNACLMLRALGYTLTAMPRIGLVLGAGGLAGQAFQGGVLSALADELGWDPRDADLIVGTSAGSFSGALLRLGVPAADLAAWAAQ